MEELIISANFNSTKKLPFFKNMINKIYPLFKEKSHRRLIIASEEKLKKSS